MEIDRLDHLVLTVRDVEATCAWYARVLGMQVTTFGEGRKALAFGQQKLNLQQQGQEAALRATHPVPGSADLCFVTRQPLDAVAAHLAAEGVPVEAGPVGRMGALGPMTSLYFRDPDLNLIEVSHYADGAG